MGVANKKWTVYIHTSPSNKKYVGITSVSADRRWRNGKGYKSCVLFNKAIEKYGWDNFKSEIIAKGLSQKEAFELEKELIVNLKSNDSRYGYNITSGGEGTTGHTVSKETRKRLSVMFSGKNNPNYGRTKEKHPLYGKTGGKSPSAKKVMCLNTLKAYESLVEAGQDMNCNPLKIGCCCNGIRKTCGVHPITNEKLVWMYLHEAEQMSEEEINSYIQQKQKKVGLSNETKDKIGKSNGLKVVCLNTKEIFCSINEAARIYKVPYSGIGRCCKGLQEYSGKHPTTKEKLKWAYFENKSAN